MDNFIIASRTDTGRVRSVNEDSMAQFDSPNGRVIVVCDGMGGQNAGDVASQLAVAVIQDILTDNIFASPEEAITKSVVAANQALLRRASLDPSLQGMGATCVMVIVKDGKFWYGSVGDSRIYYVADRMIQQLTKDQSYVQALVDAGQISAEDAVHHKDKNQITNALGVEGMTPPVICDTPIVPTPGSVVLLCSDGLTGMVDDGDLLRIISRRELSLDERAQLLITQANEAGGLDNVTVQLVEFAPSEVVVGAMGNNPYAFDEGSLDNRGGKTRRRSKSLMVCCMLALALLIGGTTAYVLTQKDDQKKEQKKDTTTKALMPQTKKQPKKVTVQVEQDETPEQEAQTPAPKNTAKSTTTSTSKSTSKTTTTAKSINEILNKTSQETSRDSKQEELLKAVNPTTKKEEKKEEMKEADEKTQAEKLLGGS